MLTMTTPHHLQLSIERLPRRHTQVRIERDGQPLTAHHFAGYNHPPALDRAVARERLAEECDRLPALADRATETQEWGEFKKAAATIHYLLNVFPRFRLPRTARAVAA